jgi:uncharacterized protein (UPF0548 family)
MTGIIQGRASNPMFRISAPTEREVAEFIAAQRNLPLTYAEVGATSTQPPAGYNVDHNRVRLGEGEATYERAIEALKNWRHFDLGWVTIVPRGVAIEAGAIVAVKARVFGTWSLSACRVVYVIDEPRRFGFAYGTLPDHVECGEERFLIERLDDDSVWYDIVAFSHPHHPLARLSSPLARRLQKRFARESLTRMKSATDLQG